jgi:alkanesulfonate monooxygenase SsuD/methylene tetrahydromethanopterin reductase-like flavin-dependent oxidoreductase (luciferase family)
MKVLLNNNIPIAIRKLLGKHRVLTSAYMGWTHLQNGDLLAAAEAGGFDAMLTADQTLRYQLLLSQIQRQHIFV